MSSCGGCHQGNGLGTGTFGPDVTGAAAADIQNAIATVAAMGSVAGLTDEEIQAIADAL